jgi:DNA polymerase-1
LYLIDGSSYIYRAFHALPPLTSPRGVPTQAVYGFTTMLLKLLNDVEASYLAVIFDAPGKTFRDDLYDQYKANRAPAPDELKAQIPMIHEVVDAFRICKIAEPGVEADDVIATLVRRHADDMECVIVTGDKDLMQLVRPSVRLWDTMRDRWVDEKAVREKFGVAPGQVVDVMALMGDSIDNIPGVKGVGAKTASALIEHFGDVESLLARLEEVPELGLRGAKKVADRLRDDADNARISRELVVLDSNVALDIDLDAMKIGEPDMDALREIFTELGFQSLIEQVARVAPAPAVEVVEVASADEARRQLSEWFGRVAPIAVAALTEDGPVISTAADRLLFFDGSANAIACALDGPGVAEAIAELLADSAPRIVGYDLKKMGHSLALRGIHLPEAGFDVMVASYVVDPTAAHDLASIVSDHIGGAVSGYGQSAETTASVLAQILEVARILSKRLADAELTGLFTDLETPLIGVLARIEARGLSLDVARLREMGREFAGRLDALMEEIHAIAGHPFNINSPPQLRTVLFEELGLSTRGVRKGKTGFSTDVDVLTRLAADHPLPAKILEYRALSKLKSTYIDALPQAVDVVTGRLHTTLHQTVAATGRISSSDPNLQNIPIRGEEGRRIREAFVAPTGRVLIAADYSQIELRVLAHLSGDPVLREAFREGQDIHTRTAAEVFGVLPGTVTSDMRRSAKVINFGILYGMGPQRLARDLGISLAEAKHYIESYFERYAGVRRFMEAVVENARETGFVRTILGRRRPVPELLSGQRGIVQAAERVATNTPIQGSAADIIKLAMLHVDQRLTRSGLDGFMILQVHDELLVETAEADLDRVIELVRDEMAQAIELSVPLEVEVGSGRTWAEAH